MTKSKLLKTLFLGAAISLTGSVYALDATKITNGEIQLSSDQTQVHFTSKRPIVSERLFVSKRVEKEIVKVQKLLKNAKLSWMFGNCFPNTLDTTVRFEMKDDKPDTSVYTGDIHAMWLRDSGAQVWPYVQFANEDPDLKLMLAGTILRQFNSINLDPYANAFYTDTEQIGSWKDDITAMKPGIHERKWEIDSLCYPIRLAHHYWEVTGDTSIFGEEWLQAVSNILKTLKEQQRKDGVGQFNAKQSVRLIH